ncbi:carboxylesterase family protein [Actinomadura sp. LD22]|uniref:Carboxylic ester hydrolase n=1 Tax=Actinomadura physcomitrii TaxID=2650748 RepID=A0A6I4MRJ4_9ACTN|nr:carboxylesterase/lipase family protein [Actinomadura physcomitrii]MWA04916.1 carboxylesterase family protein [Actinomadura physcomitrii]
MRFGRILLAILSATALAGAAALPARAAAQAAGDTVTVKDGVLRGTVNADERLFLGIPYAAPPTGDRRFRPPQPAAPWQGVRDATKEGSLCPQIGLGSEDCLVLNVYTPPEAESKNLPVMVYLPGGAYVTGWGSGYDPTPLVTKGKVIAVTVNYRLGPLGFMALPALAGESGTTGNYGLLDQQAALRWVRDNIGAFGGDARNVTLFGESAGGNSVCMQLQSPGAAGLFHKAISQSGACGTTLGPVPAATAYATSTAFARKLGCTDPATMPACLRGKPAGDLSVTAGELFGSFGPSPLSWTPVIDGHVIKEPTLEALASGHYNKVPLISGSNKDEGRLFTALNYHLSKFRHATADDLKAEVRFRAGDDAAQQVLDAYPPASADNADLAVSSLTTDTLFACPALATNQSVAANPGQKLYAYEFADPKPPMVDFDPLMPLGAYHSADIFYLFKGLNGIPPIPGLDTAQQQLSDKMIAYWTTFAKTGDPNGPTTPSWPAFTASSPQVQRLSREGTAPFTTFATDHKCRLWIH